MKTNEPLYEAYHDDPPCNEKLNKDGYCPVCGFYPDMQSVSLKELKKNKSD